MTRQDSVPGRAFLFSMNTPLSLRTGLNFKWKPFYYYLHTYWDSGSFFDSSPPPIYIFSKSVILAARFFPERCGRFSLNNRVILKSDIFNVSVEVPRIFDIDRPINCLAP